MELIGYYLKYHKRYHTWILGYPVMLLGFELFVSIKMATIPFLFMQKHLLTPGRYFWEWEGNALVSLSCYPRRKIILYNCLIAFFLLFCYYTFMRIFLFFEHKMIIGDKDIVYYAVDVCTIVVAILVARITLYLKEGISVPSWLFVILSTIFFQGIINIFWLTLLTISS